MADITPDADGTVRWDEYQLRQPLAPALSLRLSADEASVTIHYDGRVELGDGITLDDASRRFWDAIQEMGLGSIARVRALHRPIEYRGSRICAECSAADEKYSTTDNSPVLHPCDTIRALDGPDVSTTVQVREPETIEADANPFTFVFQQVNGYGDSRWGWRCNGIRHCTGDVNLDHASDEAAAASYTEHATRCHGTQPTVDQLHERFTCPAWEYATTEGPRRQWDDAGVPPYGDDGEPDTTWERNTAAGRDGWERFDYTEESYWRRRTTTQPDHG